MKEALITALTRVNIPELALTLSKGQAAFIKNVEFARSDTLQNLVKIGVVKVDWVDRQRLRKVPDVRSLQTQAASASAGTVSPSPASPKVDPIEAKLAEIDAKIGSFVNQLAALSEIRDIVRETRLSQERMSQQNPQQVVVVQSSSQGSDPALEDPTPTFIPSKILDDAITNTLNVEQSTSNVDINEAASSLRRAKKGNKT